MRDINARDFRWIVDLRAPVVTNNQGGNQVTFPTATYQTYAKIEPLTGRELQVAKEQQSDNTHKITMRANAQTGLITATWQIWFVDQLTGVTHKYEVSNTSNVEARNRLFVAYAKEIG